MIDVTTWTAHATREPSEQFLTAIDRKWRERLATTSRTCPWRSQLLHSLVLLHVDRATHKRRLRTHYFAAGECGAKDHGFTPMSALIPGDMYGPESLHAFHTGEHSALAAAIVAAKQDPHLVATTVITEPQFTAIDTFDDHSGAQLRPESHGAVVPFLYAAAGEDVEDAFEREDLLRANGYSTYTVDATTMGEDPIALHRNLAALMEDVFDEIAQLKADGAARILSRDPLWPLVIVKAPAEWNPAPASARLDSERR
ncbi:hypothetical protein [Demequina activiva]|uniref:Xylulose 5-phosphate/Fructose 6-phosphate phosphoketolase N-terminal domain-containing protein n=1 Tax=Demequina activiva TaxID=1582364 RepID=A0A919UJX2_9MICO|nr:hypothetical protein [Demequina activiva]GIG54761.1 hypothetical protein Dac01nite_15130 [Demequina activiva]